MSGDGVDGVYVFGYDCAYFLYVVDISYYCGNDEWQRYHGDGELGLWVFGCGGRERGGQFLQWSQLACIYCGDGESRSGSAECAGGRRIRLSRYRYGHLYQRRLQCDELCLVYQSFYRGYHQRYEYHGHGELVRWVFRRRDDWREFGGVQRDFGRGDDGGDGPG